MLVISLVTIIIVFSLLWVREHAKVKAQKQHAEVAETVHKALWSNAHEYIFLIDKTSHVRHTNYYELNNIPPREDWRCFGEIFQCCYARENKQCSCHVNCKSCAVRNKMKETFLTHATFKDLETTMDIQFPSGQSGLYNMLISGRYLSLKGEDYLLLTVHDVSEERALESSLKHSNEKFLCFFDNVTVGCAICDKTGTLLEVNDTYVDYIGVDSKEQALNHLNIYNNPCINKEFKEMIRKGIPVFGEVKYDYEKINRLYLKSRHKDVHYYRFIANYLRDAKGEVEYILLIWVENTFVHKTLRMNKSFREMITYASSISKIGFCSVNLLKDEHLVTPEFLKNLGIQENIDMKRIFASLKQIHPDDSRLFREYIDMARTQKMDPLEKNIRVMVDGEYRWIKQYLIQQTFDPSSQTNILASVNVDIDAQKKIEEELRESKDKAESSDRLKSAFLANMSHEIRTPLNAIVGFSNLMGTSENKEDLDSFRHIIEDNSNQLLQLIGDILDLSKIEAGTLEFVWGDVNVNAMLCDLEKIFQLKNEGNPNVEIRAVLGLENCIIRSERQRLVQLVSNLMTNAMKFTSEGSIIMGYEKREEGLYFYVKDSGCGIPENSQTQIFQRFVQLDSFKPGTGLGLSICSSIIKVMGGEIGVDSKLGEGSTFWFTLPVLPVEMVDEDMEMVRAIENY